MLDSVGGDHERTVLHSEPVPHQSQSNRDALFHLHLVATLTACARVSRPGERGHGPSDATHAVRALIPLERIQTILLDEQVSISMRAVYLAALHHVWLMPALKQPDGQMRAMLETIEMDHIFVQFHKEIDARVAAMDSAGTHGPMPEHDEWCDKIFQAIIVLLGELFSDPELPLAKEDGTHGLRRPCAQLFLSISDFARCGGTNSKKQFDLVCECLRRMSQCDAFVRLSFEKEMMDTLAEIQAVRPESPIQIGLELVDNAPREYGVAATLFANAAAMHWKKTVDKKQASDTPVGNVSRARRRFVTDSDSIRSPKMTHSRVNQTMGEFMKLDYVVAGLSELVGEWHSRLQDLIDVEAPERLIVALLNPRSQDCPPRDRPKLSTPKLQQVSEHLEQTSKKVKTKANQVIPLDGVKVFEVQHEIESDIVPDADLLIIAQHIHHRGSIGWDLKQSSTGPPPLPTYRHLISLLGFYDPSDSHDIPVISLILEVLREFVYPRSLSLLDMDAMAQDHPDELAILNNANKERRSQLVDQGVCEPILQLVGCESESVVVESLKLLNGLLEEGYRKVQDRVYYYFSNNDLEGFFFAMRKRFRTASGRLREKYAQQRRQREILSFKTDDQMHTQANTRHLRFAATGQQLIDLSRQRGKAMDNVAGVGTIGEGTPVALTLEAMRWMCERQHSGLQNWLRDQTNSRRSVNLITATINFLVEISRYIHSDYGTTAGESEPMELAVYALSALSESCIDCAANQRQLSGNSEFLRVLKSIIHMGIGEEFRFPDKKDGKFSSKFDFRKLTAVNQRIELLLQAVAPLQLLCSTSDEEGREMSRKVLDTIGFVDLAKTLDSLGDEAHFQKLANLKGLDGHYDIGSRLSDRGEFWDGIKPTLAKQEQDVWETIVSQKVCFRVWFVWINENTDRPNSNN